MLLNKKILILAGVFLINSAGESFARKTQEQTNKGRKYFSIVAGYVSDFQSDIDFPDVPNVQYGFNFDSTYTVGANLGYYVDDNFRFEGEISYRKSEVDKLTINGVETEWKEDVSLWNFMLNTYFDFPLTKKFKPYVGGGLGLVHNSRRSRSAAGFQGMVGITYDIDYASAISGGYRYFKTTDMDSERAGGPIEFPVEQNIYELSYRIKF